jgi:ankyrin repeat protein
MNSIRSFACFILAAIVLGGVAQSQQSTVRSAGSSAAVTANRGETELHRAARTGDLTALQSQLKLGVNPNVRDAEGRTPLMDAAEQGQLNAAQALIKSGADLNARTRVGSALEIAERTGHSDVAAALRDAGALTNGRSVGDTVCVRPWGGDGFCGKVEAIDKQAYTLRVTQIVGCEKGCAAKAECSAAKPVGGSDGIAAGDLVTTKSWCLTHTGVQQ